MCYLFDPRDLWKVVAFFLGHPVYPSASMILLLFFCLWAHQSEVSHVRWWWKYPYPIMMNLPQQFSGRKNAPPPPPPPESKWPFSGLAQCMRKGILPSLRTPWRRSCLVYYHINGRNTVNRIFYKQYAFEWLEYDILFEYCDYTK